jgi:hypothetical protein
MELNNHENAKVPKEFELIVMRIQNVKNWQKKGLLPCIQWEHARENTRCFKVGHDIGEGKYYGPYY